MLPKKNRVNKKGIELLFKKGGTLSSTSFNFKFFRKKTTASPQISVIVPKSIAKLATKRNYLRRLGNDALSKNIKKFPPLLGTIVFKEYQEDIKILENEIKEILNKIN